MSDALKSRSPHDALVLSSTLELGRPFALGSEVLPALKLRDLNVKEAFTVGDCSGAFFRATLTRVSGSGAEAVPYERMTQSPESPFALTLVCAILGRQRMLQVVQKATELGAVRIVPVFSEHSVQPRDLEKEKPWAWPAQAVRAMRQCRRACVPQVSTPVPLELLLQREADLALWVMDDAPTLVSDVTEVSANRTRAAALVVGPEGGWSSPERALFMARGARVLALGTRILRAETAVYAGLAILQARYGDLNSNGSPSPR
jgi:16S rRNA (uracil1498-N3)-methyltransferase